MKKAVVFSLLLPMTMATLLGTSATAFASTPEQTMSMNQTDNQSLTTQTIQSVDKYVTVSGNRYHLSATAAQEFSKGQLIQINQSIDQANRNVAEQQLKIDSKTKVAEPTTELFAAYNTKYTTKNFWWGTRYYFTSNAAVRKMCNELGGIASAFNIGGAIAGILSNGAASAVAGAANIYFSHLSSGLNRYNNQHPHNQIYMDVSYSGGFSYHILA